MRCPQRARCEMSWQKIKCWLGDLLKKDWHDWEFDTFYTELENSNAIVEVIDYKRRICKHCGKVKR